MPRSKLLLLSFAAIAITGGVLVAASLLTLRSYQESADETLQAAQVTVIIEALLIDISNAESAKRGYLLTDDESYRERYEEALAGINRKMPILGETVGQDAAQAALFNELTTLVDNKVTELEETVTLAHAGRADEAIRSLLTGDGEALNDAILENVSAIVRIEADQHEVARDRADRRGTQSVIAVSALAVVTAALLAWVFWAIRRHGVEESLRRSNREKDEFLGMVSHELRTPITVVLGNARLLHRLGKQLPEDEFQKSLDDIASHGERMQRIVENMLTLSREQAVLESVEPVLLPRLIATTIERSSRGARGPEIRVSVSDGLPLALANDAYVEQVLHNLISNATKYGPAEGPIDIEAWEAEGQVHVSVADRGPGIQPEKRALIFEPFVRLPDTEKSAEGLGLGLPVCRRLMRSQGGDITVSDRPGGGTVFTISLAIAQPEVGDGAAAEPLSAGSGGASQAATAAEYD